MVFPLIAIVVGLSILKSFNYPLIDNEYLRIVCQNVRFLG